jgi:hypothetical protein
MIGIYKIVNTINNSCYVGSSINFKERKGRHFKMLRKGNHHSIILQRAYNKYGVVNFIFSIIEECDKSILLSREQYWIDTLKPVYNVCKIAGSPLGTKQSIAVRNKKRKYALDNNIIPPKSTWEDRQKQVLMLNYNTLEIINTFVSASEACRYVGKDCTFTSTITSCCKNKRFSAFGYRWVFNESDITNLRSKIPLVPWNKGLH